jgi:hypothetical protein
MTRKQNKFGVIIPRKKIVALCAIAAAVIVATFALQWLVITRSNSFGNSEFFSDLPDVDLSAVPGSTRDRLVRQANSQPCPCNCGLTLACCRNRDRSCQTSLKVCREMVKQASDGGAIAMQLSHAQFLSASLKRGLPFVSPIDSTPQYSRKMIVAFMFTGMGVR